MAKKQLVPFSKQDNLPQTPFGNMLDNFFSDFWYPARLPDPAIFKLDVREDDKGYTIDAEMPGAKKEDITLNLENGRLTIGVEAKQKKEEKEKKKVVHQERSYSYMERSVYLADADDGGVQAKLDNGVLVITVPKVAGAKSTKIDIG